MRRECLIDAATYAVLTLVTLAAVAVALAIGLDTRASEYEQLHTPGTLLLLSCVPMLGIACHLARLAARSLRA